MTDYYKVEGNDSLIRDGSSKAIINTNAKEYQNYVEKRNMMAKQKQEIDSLKKDMSEIKEMLATLIGKQ
jgi:DNA topoisomerase VI subunit B